MRLGLGAKFVLMVAGILSVTLSVISYFVFYTQDKLFQAHLNEKVQILGRFVALISVEQVLSYDYFSLNNFVKEITTANDMAYAVLHDRQGKTITNYVDHDNPIIAEATRKTKLEKIGELATHLAQDPLIINLSFPILFQGETIGTVTIGASRARLQHASNRLFVQQLTANAVIITFLSFAIYLAFRLAALRPINLLTFGAQRIAAGNLDIPVTLKSTDELGRLAQSFNTMMTQLKQSIREKDDAMLQLQNLNKTLEQRVEDRTLKLTEKEAHIRAVIEHIGEGIATIDEHYHIASLNPAGQKIFGHTHDSAIGTRLDEYIFGPCRTQFASLVCASRSGAPSTVPQAYQSTELQARRLSGELLPIDIVITPMDLPNKQMFVCIVRDITRRKETERQLADAQQRLLDSAHKAGMADIATSVLHNIGNILNSVQISTDVLLQNVRNSKITGLVKANALLAENIDHVAQFVSEDTKGKLLPQYYLKVGQALHSEYKIMSDEAQALSERVRMMRDVISTQQSYARQGLFEEEKDLHELIEDALRVQLSSLTNAHIIIEKRYGAISHAMTQKVKILQVMVNLIKNAKEAMEDNDQFNEIKRLTIETGHLNEKTLYVDFIDNGCGVAPENATLIFKHGFTTKAKGHGFGLHAGANAMAEMGGKLSLHSDASQRGARFRITVRAAPANTVNTRRQTDPEVTLT